jgi:hypothetical protein
VGGGDVDCYLDVVGGLVCLFDLKGSDRRNPQRSDKLRVTWNRRKILNGRRGTISINITEKVSWKRDMPSGLNMYMFLINLGTYLPNYTVSRLRR